MNIFRSRIRKSIADENLQIALDNNARRRKEGRLAALSALPDLPERRQQAHVIKAGIVDRLEENLADFIARVSANGIQVHMAKDADEALRIFMDIAGQVEARKKTAGGVSTGQPGLLVAKAKSMVSEEINFNHALEKAGMRPVETDLGEYIVQLRGERPSHIITPAVHLRRNDVGRLFEEKLGLPYTEDIPVLTDTARRVLRQVFLEADIGISGVNFGVVETGTLVLVTNEGNGRMCTTLPKVHVALMGIERLVPGMDDLALFLSLLPRSATGQNLSVYTSLINAPLPGQERHLVLLDNGRRALQASPLAEVLYCIRCGACLNACPVFREIGGHAYGSIYPGPIGSVISCALVDPQFETLSQASSLCGACREACPVDIDLPGLLLRVRAGQAPAVPAPGSETIPAPRQGAGISAVLKFGLTGFRLAASDHRLFSVLQALGGAFSRLLSPRRAQMRLPVWTGWGFSKDMSRIAPRSFRRQFNRLRQDVLETPVPQLASEETASPQPPAAIESLASRFTRELEAIGGHVHHVQPAQVEAKVAELLASRSIDRVLVDDAGAEVADGSPAVREPDPTVRAGITGALAGIADTGSLLLVSGAGQTLTASLLPEIHLVVLKASRMLPSLQDALRLPEVATARAGVVITGPSRTADIEMTLTIGVHGPGELHVLLIDDSMPV
jgi:L-lactate dehydrogenase complex protein LldF